MYVQVAENMVQEHSLVRTICSPETSIGNNGSNTSLMSQTSIHVAIAASRTALLHHLLRSYHFRLQNWEFKEFNGNEIRFERRGYKENTAHIVDSQSA